MCPFKLQTARRTLHGHAVESRAIGPVDGSHPAAFGVRHGSGDWLIEDSNELFHLWGGGARMETKPPPFASAFQPDSSLLI